MAANKVFRVILALTLLLTGLFLIRNLVLLNRINREIGEMAQLSENLSTSPETEEALQLELDKTMEIRTREESRYHENPSDTFYEFAESLTDAAAAAGLTVTRATASGHGTEKTWELEVRGTAEAVLGLLEDLDQKETHFNYLTVSLQRAPDGAMEAFIAIRLPALPSFDEKDLADREPADPVIPLRAPVAKLVTIFGTPKARGTVTPTMTAIKSTDKTEPPPLVESGPKVAIIGHYTDSEGNEVLALKDLETTLVRRLRPGEAISGWTLLSISNGQAKVRIKNQTITLNLEAR